MNPVLRKGIQFFIDIPVMVIDKYKEDPTAFLGWVGVFFLILAIGLSGD